MRHGWIALLFVVVCCAASQVRANDPATTIAQSEQVLAELVAIPGRQIPARLLADAIQRLIRANPLLAEVLEVQRNVVVNTRTKSELRIISSDVGSSYGILADFIVVDELTHWTTAGEGLWHSLLSTAAKKPNCLLVIISNAGVGQGESWQWNVREAARTSDTWHFHSLNGAVASWISPKLLDEQKRLLPAVAYRRLWENQWCTLTGDALDMEDIERVFANELGPLASKESGYVYAGGLDLSVSRDHSSFVVVGRNTKTNAYRVARCWLWKPPRGGKVNLEAIEETIVTASKLFGLKTVACDPFQAAYLIERLTNQSTQNSQEVRQAELELAQPAPYRVAQGRHRVKHDGG